MNTALRQSQQTIPHDGELQIADFKHILRLQTMDLLWHQLQPMLRRTVSVGRSGEMGVVTTCFCKMRLMLICNKS